MSVPFPFKPDNIALVAVKFHTDKIDFRGACAILGGIAFLFDLLKGRSRGLVNVYNLEFKDSYRLDNTLNAVYFTLRLKLK
ncbi:hypothetical protein [Desulfobacter curvatus]|uniref:hypothetical protein n=1 Tax=Desulfobacter curvatus TaxID=2290 RepID=UPI000363A3BD